MRVIKTALPDLLLIESKVFTDDRGHFFESWNRRTFESLGIAADFVQDNHSRSTRNVLRGLHYQIQHPQESWYVLSPGRRLMWRWTSGSPPPTFGKWAGFTLSAANMQIAWIPPGFAHGFLTLSESAEFLYKTTDYWYPGHERTLHWNDPTLRIAWPLTSKPFLAPKDQAGMGFRDADTYA